MNLEVKRHRILISTGQNEVDVAFMEEVLGLQKDGDTCIAQRVNAANLDSFAYLEIKKRTNFTSKPYDLSYIISVIRSLSECLPDADAGKDWKFCWEELNSSSQDKVKEVRKTATELLISLRRQTGVNI